MKSEIEELLEILGIPEKEAIRALLSAFGPTQPGALSAAWKHRSNYQGSLPSPTTEQIWCMFEAADFRCTRCGSQLRITLDHKNGDQTDHRSENLEVLCFECNRGGNERGIKHKGTSYRIYRATVDLYGKTGRFPSNREIIDAAELDQPGGNIYLIRYIQKRMTGSCPAVRGHTKQPKSDGLMQPSSDPRGQNQNL